MTLGRLILSQSWIWVAHKESVTFYFPTVFFQDFINKELILFSNMDNERSIPSLVDGFKPGQRKILFTCIKRNFDKKEIKVAQLSGNLNHIVWHPPFCSHLAIR